MVTFQNYCVNNSKSINSLVDDYITELYVLEKLQHVVVSLKHTNGETKLISQF